MHIENPRESSYLSLLRLRLDAVQLNSAHMYQMLVHLQYNYQQIYDYKNTWDAHVIIVKRIVSYITDNLIIFGVVHTITEERQPT